MGKITVKHYLNTKIKPKEIDGKSYYPVYIRIIYNKFSAEKKSETEILATPISYEHYEHNGKWIDDEVKMGNSLSYQSLDKEINVLYSGVCVVEKFEISVDRKSLLIFLEQFSKEVNKVINEIYFFNKEIYVMMGSKSEKDYNVDYEKFILSFDRRNILKNISDIKNYTKVDLTKYLKEDTILDMEAMQLIEQITKPDYKNYNETYISFSEFVCMGYDNTIRELLKNRTVEYYDKIIATIKKLIDDCIETTCESGVILYI